MGSSGCQREDEASGIRHCSGWLHARSKHREFSGSPACELRPNDRQTDHSDRFWLLRASPVGIGLQKQRLPGLRLSVMLRPKELYASSDAEEGRKTDYRE